MSVATVQNPATEAPVQAFRRDSLAESMAIMLALTVFQRVVGLVRAMLFCRWLEPEELGQWDLAFGFLMLAAPLAVFGLPGSFGRYLEYFRQQGQLRTFLVRTTIASAIGAAAMVLGLSLFAGNVSELVFGRPDQQLYIWILAGTLATIILQHFLESMLMALRVYRVVSFMHMGQSLAFAAFGLVLLAGWRTDCGAVILAYGLACALSSTGAVRWLCGVMNEAPAVLQPIAHREFWWKLMPFAAWVWIANLLSNMFAVVDRTMLVHFSPYTPDEALIQVGCYHSSRIVPLLMISVTSLIGSMMLPHLSCDWERGNRDAVSRRLRSFLKVISVALLVGGIVILALAPLLFDQWLKGKYPGGLDVLPWTLVYCQWAGILVIAQNYLLCAEKARLCSLALLVGVIVNVVLNQLLLPYFGLLGAVLGTAGANLATLLLTYVLSWRSGMQLDLGTLICTFAAAALGLGLIPSLVTTLGLVGLAISTNWIVTDSEKQLIRTEWQRLWIRIGGQPLGRAMAATPDEQPLNGDFAPCK